MDQKELVQKCKEELEKCNTIKDWTIVKNNFLGKENAQLKTLTEAIKNCKDPSEIKIIGQQIHNFKTSLTEIIEGYKEIIIQKEFENTMKTETPKLNYPELAYQKGNIHPITIILNMTFNFFNKLGYTFTESTEVDDEFYNFEALNIPKDHVARDDHDSFYLKNNKLLRTHCTNNTVHELLKQPNIEKKIISMGKVYRRDTDDATHSHQFHQIDGVLVSKNVSIANLKWTLQKYLSYIFGQDQNVRFRSSFFPFTSPSLEVDMTCTSCQGKGCNICKQTGWIEILGAGMLHPNVLENCKYNSDFQAFAFGIGVERIAMLKFKIKDIRDLTQNDFRFLNEFNGVNYDY